LALAVTLICMPIGIILAFAAIILSNNSG